MNQKTENQKNSYLYKNLLPILKKEKTQNFTTIVLTFLTLSFFGIFAINPTITTIARLQKQLSDSKFVDQKLKEKISSLNTLQNQYALVREDMQTVLNAIPTKPETILFTALLQGVAKENNISITRLQLFQVELSKKQHGKDIYSSFPFAIETEGTQNNLTIFLSSLINFQRIISIENVSYGKTKTSDIFHLSLQGKAYFKQ